MRMGPYLCRACLALLLFVCALPARAGDAAVPLPDFSVSIPDGRAMTLSPTRGEDGMTCVSFLRSADNSRVIIMAGPGGRGIDAYATHFMKEYDAEALPCGVQGAHRLAMRRSGSACEAWINERDGVFITMTFHGDIDGCPGFVDQAIDDGGRASLFPDRHAWSGQPAPGGGARQDGTR